VVWHSRPYEAIIEQVINQHHDLVIKSTHHHDKFKSVIFTPTDWHLLRKCPAPLLLVKEHSWPKNGNIVAAINIGSDEEEHKSLNNKITESALYLADKIEGHVHLVNAYPGSPVNISIEIPEFDSSEYTSTMLHHHEKSMLNHATFFSIDKQNSHVAEGLPEYVIQKITDDLDAELVVLGTIGRTGFSAALIGNTAEHVIDSLNCDLLAIKPEGYVSPLQK
jgi:universal stress protein E